MLSVQSQIRHSSQTSRCLQPFGMWLTLWRPTVSTKTSTTITAQRNFLRIPPQLQEPTRLPKHLFSMPFSLCPETVGPHTRGPSIEWVVFNLLN